MKSHTKKRIDRRALRSSSQPDSTRLDVAEAKEQNRIAKKNIPFSRIWFFLIALLAAAGGIISLRKFFQSDQSVTERDIHSLIDLMDPPSSSLVTKIQDRQLKTSWNPTPGNLSYSEIGMLLESPEIVIVENASERKSPPSELRKKGQHVKDLISAGIADSSAVAQAHAITCLAHPAVSVKLLEKPPSIAKNWRSKLAPAQNVAGGLFHAPNATIYLFRNKIPYQIVAHELAHCGSAAMGVNGLQLPFSQGIMAKAFPCEEDVFLADARKELQAILKYSSIQEASESRVLTLAKTDSSLNKLLNAASHFKPLYGLSLQKTTFHKSKDRYKLERGTVLSHDSVIRRLSPIFPGVDLELLPKTLDFYKKAAASSPFEIFYIDEYSIEDIVLMLGTPTRLSPVTRAQLLILQAQAVEQYVNKFHPQAHCVELFASLVGSFPDEVLRILLPNSYERLFHAVEYLKRPTVPADYDRGGNERIESNPSSPRP